MVTRPSGAVLAGGAGRRLGRDKAGLVIGNGTLLERTVATLRSVCDEVMVVLADGAPPPVGLPRDVVLLHDRLDGAGPLAGLEAALAAASHDPVVVVAVDMPGLNAAVLRAQLELAVAHPEIDVVTLPRRATGTHEPLHAVYRRRLLARVTDLLGGGERRMAALLSGLRVADLDRRRLHRLDPSHRTARNVNTPRDLAGILASELLRVDE